MASRGGKKATQALDHDTGKKQKLVPLGILDVVAGLLTILVGTSRDTSDFIVDCLQQWWDENADRYGHIRQLVINLDNGPESSSHRTQFMKRLVEFADRNNLEIVLVYYPPYHSKYNSVERCWGILEAHWNGTLLNNVTTVLEWARSMTWKGTHPAVRAKIIAFVKQTPNMGGRPRAPKLMRRFPVFGSFCVDADRNAE